MTFIEVATLVACIFIAINVSSSIMILQQLELLKRGAPPYVYILMFWSSTGYAICGTYYDQKAAEADCADMNGTSGTDNYRVEIYKVKP